MTHSAVLRHVDARTAATAVIADNRDVSYAELDGLVDAAARQFGDTPQLVAITAHHTLATLVAYLACLRRGHVALMVPPCQAAAITAAHAPDIRVDDGHITRASAPRDRVLHPDLAVLLSTSGTTGNPRLVRLSRDNISSNADSIVAALGLTSADRAITTLSPAYSYGLSVINSHLAAGATLVLNSASVTDDKFWQVMTQAGVTTMAGVPHTFELLDRIGFTGSEAPHLRQLTCAGGRLPAAAVTKYAGIGRQHGFELVVMYGQTEATARIACLPGALAEKFPDSVGWPVPGGSVELRDCDADGVGRLVYSGRNVMMGYADGAVDLARGPELDELDTGDRARIHADGRIEIVGRTGSFAKVFGYRVNLADVDRALADAGIQGASVAVPNAIGVVVCHDADRVPDVVAAVSGLPPNAVRVVSVPELPRVPAGKPDSAAMARLVSEVSPASAVHAVRDSDPVAALAAAYQQQLRRPATPQDSFVSLKGDSLSYVAVSLEVERIVGQLPTAWHTRPIAELADLVDRDSVADERRSTWRQLDAGVVLRAVAILVIVASHAGVMDLRGGAHLLVALLGFNLARFSLSDPDRRRRMRSLVHHAGELLVPGVLWVALLAAFTSTYSWPALGWNAIANPTTDNPDWRYWFVEAALWIVPGAIAVVAVPWVDDVRRRYPFGFPLVAAVTAWLAFVVWVPDARPSQLFAPLAVLWIFLIGWAAAQAGDRQQRWLLSGLILATVPLSYDGTRMWAIPVLLLALVWVRRVRLPGFLAVAAGVVAEASLYIFLTHWQVLEVATGWWALVLAVIVGVAVTRGVAQARRSAPDLYRRLQSAGGYSLASALVRRV